MSLGGGLDSIVTSAELEMESEASTPKRSARSPAGKQESGEGTFMFVDGAQYVGDFVAVGGKRIRQGKGKFIDGPELYEGEWVNDAMEGQGTYKFASGASYTGGFKANKFDGEGNYEFADGASYKGGWRENKMHGKGVYIDTDKVRWKGQYHNGKFFNGKSFVMLR